MWQRYILDASDGGHRVSMTFYDRKDEIDYLIKDFTISTES